MLPSQFGPAAHGHSAAGRVVELDSLRGVAAATVVVHHLWGISSNTPPAWYFVPITSGQEAVILFFVLSGYVLSLPVWTGRQSSYPIYLVRRIFRIYVPFVAALILSAIGCTVFYKTHLQLTDFYMKTWQDPVTLRDFLHQLTMPDIPTLNGAMWSLRYEMELSILFPFICWFLARSRYLPFVLLPAIRLLQMWIAHRTFTAFHAELTILSDFLYYSLFFIAGALLARERAILLRFTFLLKAPVLYLSVVVALLLYYHRMFLHLSTPQGELLTLIGSLILLVAVQDPRASLGMNNAVCQYLGRISYSMYLIHYVVLFALFDLAYGRIPFPLLICLCLVATLAVSHLFCISVEEPSLRLGKYLSKRLPRASRA